MGNLESVSVRCVVGEVCGQGRGECVAKEGWGDYGGLAVENATAEALNATIGAGNATGYCQCGPGWSGKSDMLNFDGYACIVNTYAEMTVYSFSLLAIAIGVRWHIQAVQAQLKAFRVRRESVAKKGKKLRFWEFTGLLIIGLGCVIVLPGTFIVCLPKALNLEWRSIATDLIPTASLAVMGPVTFLTSSLHDIRFFKVVAVGAGMRRQHMDKVVNFMRVAYGVVLLFYTCLTVPSMLYGLLMDPVPPAESPMRFFLILRNMLTISYMVIAVVIQVYVRKQTEQILLKISASSKNATAGSKALESLDKLTKSKKSGATVLFIVYVIFTLPWLWHLQSMPIGIFIILGQASKTSYVHSYRPSAKTQGKSTVGASSGRTDMGTSQMSTAPESSTAP